MTSSTLRGVDQSVKLIPCFTADVVLSLPNIVSGYKMCYTCTVHVTLYIHVHVRISVYICMHYLLFLLSCFFFPKVIQPSLEDIQNAVNTAVQCVTDVGQYVQLWTIPSPTSSLSNTPRSNDSKLKKE